MEQKIFKFLLPFLLISTQVFATSGELDKEITLNGIWNGTIGKQAVMACFENGDARYFYLRHSQLIKLTQQNDNAIWLEKSTENPTGIWHIKSVLADSLTATWSDKKDGRSIPIHLRACLKMRFTPIVA